MYFDGVSISMASRVRRRALGPALKELGATLKSARTAAGLTQIYVSKQLGVSVQAVSNWEIGKYEPKPKNIEHLAKLYGVSIDKLLQAPAESVSNVHSPSGVAAVSVCGYVSAGEPREAWETYLGTAPVGEELLMRYPNLFALIISGDSLEGDGIHSGDKVFVDPDAGYQVGKIYIVRLEDGEVCAKHLYMEADGQIKLRSSNDGYEDLTVSGGQVLGRVVWHLRRM